MINIADLSLNIGPKILFPEGSFLNPEQKEFYMNIPRYQEESAQKTGDANSLISVTDSKLVSISIFREKQKYLS